MVNPMTPRQRFTSALKRQPFAGRVPNFELVFFLTMEAFGKVHPVHRNYYQWGQMTRHEQDLHLADMAQLYIDTAERFEHDAIFLHANPWNYEGVTRLVDAVRDRSGDKFFLTVEGDATSEIPNGEKMMELSVRMAEEPEKMDAELSAKVDAKIELAEKFAKHGGLDGFCLCSDYCFNSGPFLPLPWFDRFVLPNLKREIKAYREMGFFTIKHTDGNIMPILDRLVEAKPDAIHSIDPQGGVDIAEVAQRVGDKVAIIGNVNCGLLQTGTDEECVESARYALKGGMLAPGYIFGTSNCVYTGMELRRYELMLEVWRKEGYRKL